MRVIALGLLAVTWLPVGARAESTGRALPRFRAEIEVVNLDVSATDAAHRNVAGLREGDFTVLEDGIPQRLCLFEPQHMPFSLSILIDNSLSMRTRLDAVQTAATRLIRTLRKSDRAQVVQFNHRYAVVQDFTDEAAALEAAVQGIRAEGATALYNAIYVSLRALNRRAGEDGLRRRALVVLTDGADTSSLLTDDQVRDAARRAEVTVYTISLQAIGISATKLPTPETQRATYFLTNLSRDTGGKAYFPQRLDDLDGVYDHVGEELRTQYMLGYVSSNGARDGRWRNLAVHSARGGVQLRHRLGYYAARAPSHASTRTGPAAVLASAGGHPR